MHVYKQYIFIIISVLILNLIHARATNDNSAPQERSHFEDQQSLDDNYEPQRYRRHPQNVKKKWENELQKREAYGGSNEASIQVILDPRAKKAVAVVENNADGQATYDLTDDNSAELDQQNAQVVNLVYPGTANRKNRQYSSGSRKRKRNVDTQRRRLIRKVSDKRSSKEAAVPTKRKTESTSKVEPAKITNSNCPPQHAEPVKEDTEKIGKDMKRETEKWSQVQLDALSASLTKVRENTEEIDNLKNILSEMGLLDNARKREVEEDAEKDESKREAGEPESVVIKREDVQKADDEAWANDVNSAPQEVEKRETAEEDNDEESIDESLEKRKSHEQNEELQKNEESSKELQNSDISREKRQDSAENAGALPNSAENEENFNEAETSKEKRKNSDEEEYEKKMESQIQAKIDAIKEKVKREISSQENVRSKRDLSDDAKALKGNKECKETTNKKEKKETSDKNMQKRELDLKTLKVIPNSLELVLNTNSKAESNSKLDQSKLVSDTSSNSKLDQQILGSETNSNLDSKLDQTQLSSDLNSNFDPNSKLDQSKLSHDSSANLNSNLEPNSNQEQVQINPAQSSNVVQNSVQENDKLIVRRKRANGAKMIYKPFQADENENNEEDNEFDDNGYDGRVYLEKRDLDGEEDDYYEPRNRKYSYYYPENRRRRSFEDYESSQFQNGADSSRKALLKRKSYTDMREKRKSATGNVDKQSKEVENDGDDSENEYFGPLPASYNGELTRYKRVKRFVDHT